MNPYPDKWPRVFYITATVLLIVAALYWTKVILIPLTTALLLAFVLGPLVNVLQHKGLGRIPSVLIIMTLTLLFCGSLLFVFFSEVKGLAGDLPTYRAQIVAKGKALREAAQGSWTESFMKTFKEIADALDDAPEQQDRPEKMTVQVEQSVLPLITAIAGSALEVLANAGLVFLLVMFMLIQREELRNRVLSVLGKGHMTHTTKAFDDASRRISRFLLMQALVNGSYGTILGGALYFIGVPHALVWGMFAAVLRYIPYIGPWLGAAFPLALSVAVAPDWSMFLRVLGVIVVLELISNNVMEPWLYGRSIGVSELALLVAAAFWAWLWGPLGLILSTPLTACLVVVSRHIPQLEAIHVLLGDQKPLSLQTVFYQRLLAHDEDEASSLVEGYLAKKNTDNIFDGLFLPALMHARADLQRGLLQEDEFTAMVDFVGEVTQEVVVPAAKETAEPAEDRPLVLALPTTNERDGKLLEVFQEFADSVLEVEVLPTSLLPAEMLERIAAEKPKVLLLGALDNTRTLRARLWCKRLRQHFPETRIVVAAWGDELEERQEQSLKDGGAYDIGMTFLQVRDQLVTLSHLDAARVEPQRLTLAGASA